MRDGAAAAPAGLPGFARHGALRAPWLPPPPLPLRKPLLNAGPRPPTAGPLPLRKPLQNAGTGGAALRPSGAHPRGEAAGAGLRPAAAPPRPLHLLSPKSLPQKLPLHTLSPKPKNPPTQKTAPETRSGHICA